MAPVRNNQEGYWPIKRVAGCVRPSLGEIRIIEILVWRLDRWGRSLHDLVVTLKELVELGIGFVSLAEAFDMTTPTDRALAGMLAVFAEFEREILCERVKAGIAQARAKKTAFGRPKSAAKKTAEIQRLYRKEKLSKSEIARRLGIGRTSVRRLLESA